MTVYKVPPTLTVDPTAAIVVNVPEPEEPLPELEDAELPDAELALDVELDDEELGVRRLVIVCVALYAIVPLSDWVCATVVRATVP